MTHLQDAGRIILGVETYVIREGSVLMHKRSAAKKTFPGFWIGPGGHIDEGENAMGAAIREVREETGVYLKPRDLKLKALAFHRHIDRGELYILYMFLARITENQPLRNITSEGESHWIPLTEIPALPDVFPASAYYFDHILNDKPGILYTNAELENADFVRIMDKTIS